MVILAQFAVLDIAWREPVREGSAFQEEQNSEYSHHESELIERDNSFHGIFSYNEQYISSVYSKCFLADSHIYSDVDHWKDTLPGPFSQVVL